MTPAPTIAYATLGCRLNQVDSRQLQGRLEDRGFRTVPFGTRADVVVVNTCTVTARAELSDRQAIRRARRDSPGARVVVTGCWAQTNPADVAGLGGVDLIVGNADKPRLPDLLASLLDAEPAAQRVSGPPRVEVSDIGAARIEVPGRVGRIEGRSRAFVKIQDGCQHRCAFCIVPFARGASRSVPGEVIEEEVRRLVACGHPEVVLTGIDLGHWGADLTPRSSLAPLLQRLVQVPGLRWLRLSSMLPAYFSEAVLDVLTTAPAIAPHFHVPLQSGSDRILRLMRRPYTVAMYRRVIERLTAAIPGAGLGADAIVGFPGESDADFEATLDLVNTLPFSYLHVFPYSERRGTEAAGWSGRVDSPAIAGRARRLRRAATARGLRFRQGLVGRVEDVLVLQTRDRATGDLIGLTGSFVEVTFPGPERLIRRLARVRVTAAGSDGVHGTLEDAA
jgi:threonylcarbamoyladenosine tRNA methylthiotransferase MtaB